jgi:hypothetical protein
MADQIAIFDEERLKSRPATLSHDDICAVERAICVQVVVALKEIVQDYSPSAHLLKRVIPARAVPA